MPLPAPVSRMLLGLLVCLAVHGAANARTENGNDFCLYLSEAMEAGNRDEIATLKEEAEGVNYYFRYLEVADLQSGREDGRPYVDILAREPSSYLMLRFRVRKSVSLTKLMEEPRTAIGSAVAVTGRAKQIDVKAKLIELDPVIVRHKDRLIPKVGKEMLGELDPSARYYSYTAVKDKPVAVSHADKDLIENNRHRIPDFEAPYEKKEAWADFLLRELAKRERVRAREKQTAKEEAGIFRGATNAPVLRTP